MAHQFLLSSITLPWCTIIYFTYRLVAYLVPILAYQRANLFFSCSQEIFAVLYLFNCFCLLRLSCELVLYENECQSHCFISCIYPFVLHKAVIISFKGNILCTTSMAAIISSSYHFDLMSVTLPHPQQTHSEAK